MIRHRYIVAALAFCTAIAPASGADAQLTIEANRSQIYLGEPVLLTVTVSGAREVEQPDLSTPANVARVRLRDTRTQNLTQVAWVNGRLQRQESFGRTFLYEVTPHAAGELRVGPITVEADGSTLTHPGPLIQVQGVEQQDRVHIELKPSREAVLVDEPFEVLLNIYVQIPDPNQPKLHPLDPSSPPRLDIPYLSGEPPDGLDGPTARDVLRALLEPSRRLPGFAVNNFTLRRDPFDMNRMFDFDGFFEETPAKFGLPETRTIRDGKPYFLYELKVTYTPREQRSYTFGPVIFKGPVITGQDRRGFNNTQRIFAVGAATTVRVVPPPEEGRPDSYVGILGTELDVSAELDTQSCRVGDPLTLTLSLGGNVNLRNIRQPNLSAQPDLTEHFRIYEDNVRVRSEDQRKVYEYTIRPTTPGTIELPPIRISYYDTDKRAYRTVATRPIPLRVQDVTEIDLDTVIDARPERSDRESERRSALAVAPMRVDPAGARRSGCGPLKGHLVLALAGPALFGIVLAAKHSRRAWRQAVAAHRRHNAFDQARRILRKRIPADSDDRHRCRLMQQIWVAVRHYLADRMGVPESGLTPADAGRLLAKAGIADDEVRSNEDFLERCFNAGFSGQPLPPDACRTAAARLLTTVRILEQQRRPRRKTRASAGMLWLALLFLSAGAAFAQRQAERDFLWDAANAALVNARKPDDYRHAADLYRKLTQAGGRNGVLFYNLGTALLCAGEFDDAIAWLQRAERYDGSNPDLLRNLLLAYQGRDDNQGTALPWYRALLLWHYGWSARMRFGIAAAAFALFWLGLTLRLCGLRRGGAAVARLSVLILVVFGSSALTSWHQDVRFNPGLRAPEPVHRETEPAPSRRTIPEETQ